MKYKDIEKMDEKEREGKIEDLKRDIIKADISKGKGGGKGNVREIKKTLAKMLTYESSNKDKKKITKEVKEK